MERGGGGGGRGGRGGGIYFQILNRLKKIRKRNALLQIHSNAILKIVRGEKKNRRKVFLLN